MAKVVPSATEIFSLLKHEILQHMDDYAGFLNSLEVDFIEELKQFEDEKKYSQATIDIVIYALANIFECTIVLLEENDGRYCMEESIRNLVNPARSKASRGDIFFQRTGEHYDSLIKTDIYEKATSSYVIDSAIAEITPQDSSSLATIICPLCSDNFYDRSSFKADVLICGVDIPSPSAEDNAVELRKLFIGIHSTTVLMTNIYKERLNQNYTLFQMMMRMI